GLPDSGGSLPRRFARAFAALAAADLIMSVLQLFTGAQLLPRFVVFVSSAILVPVFVAVSGLSDATEKRRAELDRVIAVLPEDEAGRLEHDTNGRMARPAKLVAMVQPDDIMPTADRPRPLAEILRDAHANLLVLDREAQRRDEIVT